MWHADVIVTRLLAGFSTVDGLIAPKVKIASLYLDQESPDDLGRAMAREYGVPIYTSVREALTLGGDALAVDAVLLIGEHGAYPSSSLGATMYPRMRLAMEIFRVFDVAGRSVPVYLDKHLSYNWLDSKWIYDRAVELKVPMMAGSCLPLAWRDPPLEHSPGTKITEAVVLLFASVDPYAVHGLEMLQCMVERRKGGESGIATVRCVQGKALYEAAREGKIPLDLIEAAARTIDSKKAGTMEEHAPGPVGILLEYNDGLRATVVMSEGYYGANWAYAARVDGKIVATRFVHTLSSFSYLGLNIQEMFLTGRPQYPLERTLLASGVVDAALRSVAAGGAVVKTPYLDIRYDAYPFDPIRPAKRESDSASEWPLKKLEHLYKK